MEKTRYKIDQQDPRLLDRNFRVRIRWRKTCSGSTWNRLIEFLLSPSHSQHSSASIFWVFPLSSTCGFVRALLLRALGQYCCDLLLAPDSEIYACWMTRQYRLCLCVYRVWIYLLVMLRLRSTIQISFTHNTLVSGLIENIAWIASCVSQRSATRLTSRSEGVFTWTIEEGGLA